jgi:hypothetical protein
MIQAVYRCRWREYDFGQRDLPPSYHSTREKAEQCMARNNSGPIQVIKIDLVEYEPGMILED